RLCPARRGSGKSLSIFQSQPDPRLGYGGRAEAAAGGRDQQRRAAFADLGKDFIRAESCSGGERHGLGESTLRRATPAAQASDAGLVLWYSFYTRMNFEFGPRKTVGNKINHEVD